eukprot:TRINITY_DN48034_c0_g1_i1.p2 TRINITY_DN48034_c0_g1~~TRINITY_DN48034_c0_g1_i1.p2  ORF type:complete len:325 (+),score=156.13 TRINITY_DN48034_c0_g1_i1:104-1078(+)
MPQQDGLSLRTKVALGLACVGLPLLAALSYNLGFVSSEDHNLAVLDNYQALNQMVRNRMQQCSKQSRERKEDNDLERMDIEDYRQEESMLQEENHLLHDTNEKLKAQAEECEDKFEKMMDKRYSEETQAEMLTRLEFQNDDLEQQLIELNQSRKEKRNDLKTRVRALRNENEQIRANLAAWQADVEREEKLMAEWESEQQRLADIDYGLGQADANKGWLDEIEHPHKDAIKGLDQHFWDESSALWNSSAEDDWSRWEDWDARIQKEMEEEDVDYLKWDDVLAGQTPAPPPAATPPPAQDSPATPAPAEGAAARPRALRGLRPSL